MPTRLVRALGWISFPLLGVLAVLTSGALRRWTGQTVTPDLWRVLEPVLPWLLPAQVEYAVDPWPELLRTSTLLTLGLLLAAAGVGVLALVRERPWWRRALLLWLLAVVPAVVVVGAAQLGLVLLQIDEFGGRGGSHIRRYGLPALADAARWGLVWGLVPAVATALLAPPRPRNLSVSGRTALVATVVLLVTGGVGAGAWLAHVSYGAELSTRSEVASPPQEAGPPAPTDPPAAVAPPGERGSGAEGRCAPDDVLVTFGGYDAAMGYRLATLVMENRSAHTCVVDRYPDIAFAADDGNEIRPDVDHGGGSGTGSRQLEAGERVIASIEWRGSQAPAGSVTVDRILLAPWAGAPRESFPATLDIVDGGPVTISAWVAAPG